MTRGRVRLQPLTASRCRDALRVDLDLSRDDGRLTLGDLRRSAERLEAQGRFESAHRMWSAVGQAASEADDVELWDYADRRAADAIEAAAMAVSERFKRSGVRFDYDAIVSAHRNGAASSAIALEHRCSISTVRRAVEYVRARDELLAAHHDLIDALAEGADAELLANHYGVDASLIRWMLAARSDRRR